VTLDEHDVAELERLAKRMLALCARARAEIDRPTSSDVRASTLSPEERAEVIAQVRQRLLRQGVDE